MRKNIFKTTVIAMAVLTIAFGMTACGKKNNTVKDNDTTVTQENVTTADKNNTKKLVFDYTDADGNTSKLEGNATVGENGEATIEVVDSNGNKTVFTGKANTDDGKLSVSDIKVSEGGTLVKTDGTEVKVSEDAKIEDATESTEATKADVVAKEEPKEDTIVADGGNTGADSNVSEGTGNENAGDNGADNGNVSDTPSNVETPDVPNTPSEPEYNEPEYVPDEPDNGNDSGNEDAGNADNSGSEDNGNDDAGSSPDTNYIHCQPYLTDTDCTEEWAITWDTIIPTSNKYIYYRIEGRRYDYFIFNESLDTAIMLYCTTNPDVEEQTKNYVEGNSDMLTYLVY